MKNFSAGLTELVCAAVVSKPFRQSLLANSLETIKEGYLGYEFRLTAAEYDAVKDIEATTLQQFVTQLERKMEDVP